jgi:hypothetical protein
MDQYEKIVELEQVIETKKEEAETAKQALFAAVSDGLRDFNKHPDTLIEIGLNKAGDNIEIHLSNPTDRIKSSEKTSIHFNKHYGKKPYTNNTEDGFYMYSSYGWVRRDKPHEIDSIRLAGFIMEVMLNKTELYHNMIALHESYMRKVEEVEAATTEAKEYKRMVDKNRTLRLVEQIIPTIKEGDVYMINGMKKTVDRITDKMVFVEYYDPNGGRYGGGEWKSQRPRKEEFAVDILRGLPDRTKKIIEVTEKIPSSLAINRSSVYDVKEEA